LLKRVFEKGLNKISEALKLSVRGCTFAKGFFCVTKGASADLSKEFYSN